LEETMKNVARHLGHILARLFGHGGGCAILLAVSLTASHALAVCGQQQSTQAVQQIQTAPQVISLAPSARTATQSITTAANFAPATITPVCNQCQQSAIVSQQIIAAPQVNTLSTFYLPVMPMYAMAVPALPVPQYSTFAAPYQACPQCQQQQRLITPPAIQQQPLEEAPPVPPQSSLPLFTPNVAAVPVIPYVQQATAALTPLLVTAPAVASTQLVSTSSQRHHFLGFLPAVKQTQILTRDGQIKQRQRGGI
jgi:hypothetical protein